MAYATTDDVIGRYGAIVVERICWNRDDDMADYTVLDNGLEDASAEIDSMISTRYEVPVDPTPKVLKTINIDLGLYYAALLWDRLTDEIKDRADHWRAHLILIAKGQAGLGVRTDQMSDDSRPPGTGSLTAFTAMARRV